MAAVKRSRSNRKSQRLWSARVTRESDALDLEQDVFKKKDPKAIARSLKRSAEHSSRRKSEPFRSAMSMLTFYMNRAGENLSASQEKVLNRAKDELRALYGKKPAKPAASKAAKKAAKRKAPPKTTKRKTAKKKRAGRTAAK